MKYIHALQIFKEVSVCAATLLTRTMRSRCSEFELDLLHFECDLFEVVSSAVNTECVVKRRRDDLLCC